MIDLVWQYCGFHSTQHLKIPENEKGKIVRLIFFSKDTSQAEENIGFNSNVYFSAML